MERQILHVDVNNAFLSWTAVERLKNGETLDIRTIPAIIGGDEAQCMKNIQIHYTIYLVNIQIK